MPTSIARSRTISRKQINSSAVVISLLPNAGSKKPGAEAGSTYEDDICLLERIALGDRTAFAGLVRRHTTKFYRVAYRFVGNRNEAEDIVQDAFIKLWEKPTVWQPERNASFTTWFYRVVVNLCLDHLKRNRPLQLIDETQIEDDRMSHEETMLEGEKQRLLERQIKLLPERQRTALNLCFYEGLSNQEAATVMGLHLKALQALVMRAKTTLKERLTCLMEL